MNDESIQRHLLELIATDRMDVPISSMSGKLKRSKPKIATGFMDVLDGETSFEGERCYARVEETDSEKARTMRAGIDAFKAAYPRQGDLLEGYIAEKRGVTETHLVFGMNEGRRITADDYRQVMSNLNYTPAMADQLYPVLMDISRNMRNKRDEAERKILIGVSDR